MPAENDTLVLDLVEWVAARPRPYAEVMEVWQTHCPRLTIWEDALDLGYVACGHRDDGASMVSVTPAGRELLRQASRLPQTRAA
jgi:hypothetical protein